MKDNKANTFWDLEEFGFERKKVIKNSQTQHFQNIFEARFTEHLPFTKNTVHSVYLSDPFLSAFEDKLNSNPIKSKIRLRTYNDSNIFWLEEKAFIYGQRLKRRKKFNCEIDLNNVKMSKIESPYINYVPTIHLSYTRKRYIDKRTNVRVNVDTNIQVVSANRLLFPYEGPVKFDLSVIEFKSDNLKNLTAMISSLGIGSTDGFSKYILGLQQIKKKQHRISYESVNEFLSTDGY